MESMYLNIHIYEKLLGFIRTNQRCLLTTVSETHGSTPQKPGSSALISNSGLIAGTVGGGIVEKRILNKADESIQTGESCYCRFDLANDISDEEDAICGGGMNIILDASPEKHVDTFQELINSLKNGIPGVLVTICESGPNGEFDIKRLWLTEKNVEDHSGSLRKEDVEVIKGMIKKPAPGEFKESVIHTSPDYEDNYIFFESVLPKHRLIIAGAGHVGKALTHYGKLLDFEVIVWDDREELITRNYLPEADKILSGKLEENLGRIKVDRNTSVVIVTRGHKNDADVLKIFLNSKAGYIGMIGSKRKVAQVREKFMQQRWATPKQWEKIYAPIGLDIHSKTVHEIALSIAAQLVKVRYEIKNADG